MIDKNPGYFKISRSDIIMVKLAGKIIPYISTK
jgi:hypothetical protein